MYLFDWIPAQNAGGLSLTIQHASLSSPDFVLACAPLAILCLLSLIPRWAKFTDSPLVFALVHSLPFFAFIFRDSLGDAGQVLDGVHARYHMSEPLATWTHYWFFRFLHEPFNFGARSAVALSTQCAGFLYLFFVAKVSNALYPDLTPSRRLIHRLMFLVAGVAFLFYGYIENPPLALPWEQWWVLASIVFLQHPSFRNLFWCSAALALATAFHGRVAFLFPALAFGCLIPSGTVLTRVKRLFGGTVIYFGLLGLLVGYIFLVEPNYISGGPIGNVTGGGNRQMFVPLSEIFSEQHYMPLLRALFVAGGILVPLGLLSLLTIWRRPSAFAIWWLGYLGADLGYVLLWEFDYGPYIDWDLVFSAVCPLLLMAAYVVARSRVPVMVIVPFLLASVYINETWAVLVQGHPLALNVVDNAGLPSTVPCATQGLKRTFYGDDLLATPVGAPQVDIPDREYGSPASPSPSPGRPFGGVLEGYISIPEPGRYRFTIMGQRNLRLYVANKLLYDRWVHHEWRVGGEREMRFSSPGKYPIRIDFYSTNHIFPIVLEIESAQYPKRKVTLGDFCHD